MSHTALEPEALAITSHFLCVPLKWGACSPSLISDTHLKPRHIGRLRSLLTKLRLVLSQSKPRLKLCRWLGGSVQKFHTPYFLQSSILTYYKHSPQRVSESSHPTQYIFEGDFSLFLFSSYIIPKWSGNVKLNRIFFYLFFRYSYESLTHSIRLSCFSLLILLYVFILWFHFSLNTT